MLTTVLHDMQKKNDGLEFSIIMLHVNINALAQNISTGKRTGQDI